MFIYILYSTLLISIACLAVLVICKTIDMCKCRKYERHSIFLFKQDGINKNSSVESSDLIAFSSRAYKNIGCALKHASEHFLDKTPHCYYFDFDTNIIYEHFNNSFTKLSYGVFGEYKVLKDSSWIFENKNICKTKYKISIGKNDDSIYTFSIRRQI